MNLFIQTTGVTTDQKTLWRSSQQSPSSPHKGWEQHRIKLFQSSFFEMEISFSCCIAVIFYFSSRPSACPACFALSHLSSERLLGLMIWTISPFIFITHIMSCALNTPGDIYICPLPDQIFIPTQIQSRIQIPAVSFSLSCLNSEWFMRRLWVKISIESSLAGGLLLLNLYSCHLRLYHISFYNVLYLVGFWLYRDRNKFRKY